MLPIFALAPLMGLARDAYLKYWGDRQNEQDQRTAIESSQKINDLLGTAPSLMYPGPQGSDAGPEQPQAGPPQQLPGSGLMADPADPRNQLQFLTGLMALRPDERRAAQTMGFGDVMTRALEQQGKREALAQAGQEAATREANINARFQTQSDLAEREFQENRKRWGDEAALNKLKVDKEIILKGQEIALNALKLRDAQAGPGPVQLGGVGQNEARVTTPDGKIEVIPLPGSDNYNAGVDTLNAGVDAYQHIKALRDSVAQHGTEAFGAEARNQATRHSLAVDALRRYVDANAKGPQAGRYSEARVKDLNELLANPSGWSNSLQGKASLLQNYDTLLSELGDKYKQQQQRTQNWPGINRAPLESAAAVRELTYQAGRGAPAPPRGAQITGVR